jgi:predicted MFS family arabinose efflux permease
LSEVPLRRNRDFMLLQSGRLLSSAGTASSQIAYPLLVLALTHSPAKAGIVAFARLVPSAVLSLPAGLAADHFNRKRLMIGADAVRALAIGGLGVIVLARTVTFWAIPAVAFVEGCGTAVFAASVVGAMRAVVPPRQLPVAVASNTGRLAAVQIAGPPLGGALFGIARSLPFIADAISYVFSTGALLTMRTPFQEEREHDASTLTARLAEGFRFLWSQPFLRTSAFVFGLLNFIGPGLLFAIVVIGRRQALSGGQVGALTAVFGACLLLGSMLSSAVRRRLPTHAVIVLEMWTWCGCAVFLIRPSVYVLTASMVPAGLAIPSTDSVVHSLGIRLTPDRLLGRVESVRSTIALLIAPLGPLAAGFLIADISARAAVGLFAASALVLALWGTLSPAIRSAPKLDEP